MLIRRIAFACVLIFTVSACQQSTSIAQLPVIQLSSRLSVSTCNAYNVARAAFTVAQSYQSQANSKAYLFCSLPNDYEPLDLEDEEQAQEVATLMRKVFFTLRPRSLPLSVNPQLSQANLFSNSGFELSETALEYQDEYTSLRLEYKAQVTPIKHLIWVLDEAKQGNYIAYFPVYLILQSDGTFAFTSVYASGY